MAFTRYVTEPMGTRTLGPERARRTARYGIWIVATGIGVAAFVVGVAVWLTGTTFRTT